MPIIGQVYRDISPSELEDATARVSPFPGTVRESSVAGERKNFSLPRDRREISDGLERAHPGPRASQRSVAPASSCLLALVIEGFAAYGEAAGPGFADTSELVDRQEPQSTPQPRRYGRDVRGADTFRLVEGDDWAFSDSARYEAKQTTSPVRQTSLIARFWSHMRREREVRQTVASLKALDDWTLKDIGLHRSQIEGIVRHGRSCRS